MWFNRKIMRFISGYCAIICDNRSGFRKHGKEVGRRGPGEFIGEMSVLTGDPASSDVVVMDSARYCYWSLRDLKRLETKNLACYNRFMMIVGQNVVERLRSLTHSGFADDEARGKLD